MRACGSHVKAKAASRMKFARPLRNLPGCRRALRICGNISTIKLNQAMEANIGNVWPDPAGLGPAVSGQMTAPLLSDARKGLRWHSSLAGCNQKYESVYAAR